MATRDDDRVVHHFFVRYRVQGGTGTPTGLPEIGRGVMETFRAVSLPVADGTTAPLASLVKITADQTPTRVLRQDGRRFVEVRVVAPGRDRRDARVEVRAALRGQPSLPYDVSVTPDGLGLGSEGPPRSAREAQQPTPRSPAIMRLPFAPALLALAQSCSTEAPIVPIAEPRGPFRGELLALQSDACHVVSTRTGKSLRRVSCDPARSVGDDPYVNKTLGL